MSSVMVDRKTIRYILKHINRAREIVAKVYGIRKSLVALALRGDISEREFYKISSVLTPQSRSPLWERYFREKHGCAPVKKDENQGDFEKHGKYYEYKVSGYNADGAVHIVQIRLWQNCDYVVQSISDDEVVTFVLSHAEMRQETKLLHATTAHGTKEVTDASRHVELRMTLKTGTEDWERWVKRYRKNHFGEIVARQA
ncbi:MAG: hypothetical protein OXU71_04565 [Gammaproteobacteria bacterium]|nr:hypothetical protein [Gammaproteobacteria bacterium]